MTSRSGISWPRIAAEFIVIVLGVTGALLADEWREARQDRALEVELLQRLTQDISVDLAEVDEVEGSADDVVRATSALLATIDDPLRHLYLRRAQVDINPDSATEVPGEALWTAITGLREFDHRRHTYDEMLATGSIRVLRNSALREALANYYGFVASRLGTVTGPAGADALNTAVSELGISDGDLRYVDNPLEWLEQIENLGFLLREQRGWANGRLFFLFPIKQAATELRNLLVEECGSACAS